METLWFMQINKHC